MDEAKQSFALSLSQIQQAQQDVELRSISGRRYLIEEEVAQSVEYLQMARRVNTENLLTFTKEYLQTSSVDTRVIQLPLHSTSLEPLLKLISSRYISSQLGDSTPLQVHKLFCALQKMEGIESNIGEICSAANEWLTPEIVDAAMGYIIEYADAPTIVALQECLLDDFLPYVFRQKPTKDNVQALLSWCFNIAQKALDDPNYKNKRIVEAQRILLSRTLRTFVHQVRAYVTAFPGLIDLFPSRDPKAFPVLRRKLLMSGKVPALTPSIALERTKSVLAMNGLSNDILATWAVGGNLMLWDCSQELPQAIASMHGHRLPKGIQLADERLVVDARQNSVSFYEPHLRQISEFNAANLGTVISVAELSERRLAFSCTDALVRVLDLDSGLVHLLDGHSNTVNASIEFPNHSRLVSCSDDATLCIWNSKTYSLLNRFNNRCPIKFMIKLHDNNRIATGCGDLVKIWDVVGGKCCQILKGHYLFINKILELYDGRLTSCSNDNDIIIWDMQESKPEFRLKGHSKPVLSIIEYGCDILASSSADGTVRLWDTRRGHCRMVLNHEDNLEVVEMMKLPDQRLLCATSDGRLWVWDLSIPRLLQVIKDKPLRD